MRRSGFKRPEYTAPPGDPGRIVRAHTYTGTTFAYPKTPADRLAILRELARDEECTVLRYSGRCGCQPETVVWAHTNALADAKGMGYKGNDSAGFFCGAACHTYIDQGAAASTEVKLLVTEAQGRTRERLREIVATCPREWRRRAAQWALDQIQSRAAAALPAVDRST